MVTRTERKKGLWWALPFHQLLSTLGTGVLAGFLAFSILPPSRARWLLTATPYFPIQIALGFLIGFTLPRFLRHWLMEWMWLLPFVILSTSFVLTPLPLVGRFEHYFGWSCRPELRCFVQLGVTLPFYAATSYSLGAFARRKIQEHGHQRETVY